MEWIDLNKIKPERSGDYLVSYTTNNQFMAIAVYCEVQEKFKHKQTGHDFLTVNHWMELPKPIRIN